MVEPFRACQLGRKALSPQVAASGTRLAHSPPQHQLRVLGHILLHKVIQECFENVSEVLQLPMQRHREQRCHIGPVSRRESALDLQSVDELVGREISQCVNLLKTKQSQLLALGRSGAGSC